MQLRWFLRRMGAVEPGRRALVVEAFCCLLAAKLALRWIPVRHVLGFLDRRRAGLVGHGENGPVEEVRWAVLAVARSSPVRFVCFPQCVAGSAMLSRRGVGSVLHYGVMRGAEGLRTHTWLQAGEAVVIGGEAAEEFTLLKSF